MDEIIQDLQTRIEFLVKQCERLKKVNAELRQHKGQIMREKEILLAKHKTAISQIEAMLSRLKLMEKSI